MRMGKRLSWVAAGLNRRADGSRLKALKHEAGSAVAEGRQTYELAAIVIGIFESIDDRMVGVRHSYEMWSDLTAVLGKQRS